MNLERFHAVVFDLFHTLTSADAVTQPGRTTSEILGMTSRDWNEQLLKYSEDRLRGKITDPFAIIERMAHAIDPSITEDTIRIAVANRAARFKHALIHIEEGTTRTLRRLSAMGRMLGLVSNADATEVLAWKDSPLAPHFDSVVFSCDAGYFKPEPEIYLICLNELGVVPRNALFVGDGGSDELSGAKRVGMETVLVTHVIERLWPERIEKARASADHVVRDIGDVLS